MPLALAPELARWRARIRATKQTFCYYAVPANRTSLLSSIWSLCLRPIFLFPRRCLFSPSSVYNITTDQQSTSATYCLRIASLSVFPTARQTRRSVVFIIFAGFPKGPNLLYWAGLDWTSTGSTDKNSLFCFLLFFALFVFFLYLASRHAGLRPRLDKRTLPIFTTPMNNDNIQRTYPWVG